MSMPSRLARLPIFYGWIIVGIAFVTMAIGVNARTAFSLLVPPILEEYRWDRGVVAGAFSFGFFISALIGPFAGRLMDQKGPRVVIGGGVVLLIAGLALGSLMREVWHFYLTLGLLVGIGANLLGYGVHSQFLPNWFVRRRGLAIGIAFSGVGVGSIILLPWMQIVIARDGWRSACLLFALITAVLLLPLIFLLRKKPQEIGLLPDGEAAQSAASAAARPSNIVDAKWAATEWTLSRALRTARFWWIALGYAAGLYAWYAVQVHQTKYLTEIGVGPAEAAWALGLVALFGVPGPDHLRPFVGPHRARMGLGDRLPRLCDLLRRPHRAAGRHQPGAALHDGAGAGLSRLRLHAGARADRGGDLRRAALRRDLRHHDARGRDRRRDRPVGERPALRSPRQLRSGVLDRAGFEPAVGGRDLHGGAAQGAARGGTDREVTHNAALPSLVAGEGLEPPTYGL